MLSVCIECLASSVYLAALSVLLYCCLICLAILYVLLSGPVLSCLSCCLVCLLCLPVCLVCLVCLLCPYCLACLSLMFVLSVFLLCLPCLSGLMQTNFDTDCQSNCLSLVFGYLCLSLYTCLSVSHYIYVCLFLVGTLSASLSLSMYPCYFQIKLNICLLGKYSYLFPTYLSVCICLSFCLHLSLCV